MLTQVAVAFAMTACRKSRIRKPVAAFAGCALYLGCARSGSESRTATAEPATTITVTPSPAALTSTSPVPRDGPPTLRFPPGAKAPRIGCFAWSETNETFACTFGQSAADAEATSLSVAFVGREQRATIVLTHGALDEPARASLDAAMRAGDYQSVVESPFTVSGMAIEVGAFRVIVSGKSIRVERSGLPPFEHAIRDLSKSEGCQARVLPAGQRIVVERRCLMLDDGVNVIETEVWGCTEHACN
jgi:hypothetical protein